MQSFKNLKIAITGIDANPENPQPGIAVAKCLKEIKSFNAELVGLAYGFLDTGIFNKDLFEKSYNLPFPSSEIHAYREKLLSILKKDKIDILIPCLDTEIAIMIHLQQDIEKLGVKLCLPTKAQYNKSQKYNLQSLCKPLGIKTPKSKIIHNADIFEKIENADSKEFKYPCLIKGPFYGSKLVINSRQAIIEFNKIFQNWGAPIIIEEYLNNGFEINVSGIGDGKGNLLKPLMMRKLNLTEQGKAIAGVTIHNSEILESCNKIVAKTKWRGPLELEFMVVRKEKFQNSHIQNIQISDFVAKEKSDNNNYHYLLEINPRFPAWINFASLINFNLVEDLVNLIINNQVLNHNENYDLGKLYIRQTSEIVSDIQTLSRVFSNG